MIDLLSCFRLYTKITFELRLPVLQSVSLFIYINSAPAERIFEKSEFENYRQNMSKNSIYFWYRKKTSDPNMKTVRFTVLSATCCSTIQKIS